MSHRCCVSLEANVFRSGQRGVGERQLSILAVHSGALGDLVLFGRLLRCMNGPVTLLAGGSKGKLLVGLGAVDRALDFDALPMHEIFSDTPLECGRLAAGLGRHDRLISCFAAGDPAAESRLAAACGAGTASFLPVRPEEDARHPTGSATSRELCSVHLLDIWRDMLGLGCCRPGRGGWAAWLVPEQWRQDAETALRASGLTDVRDYVVIHPGSGGEAKCWPPERFTELGHVLSRGDVPPAAGKTLFVLGPVECQRWPRGRIEALGRDFPVLLCPSLPTLAGLLAGAKAYVGNDSGVSHLSAAVGAPTVALFGPTSPKNFAPLGPSVRIVAAERMADISIADVTGALSALPAT